MDGLMSPADLRAAVNNQPIADTNRHSTVKQHLLHASLKGQILNRAFVLAALFAVINVLSINFYIVSGSERCPSTFLES